MPIKPDEGGGVVVRATEDNVLARRTTKSKQCKCKISHDNFPFCSVLCHELDGQPLRTVARS